MVSKLISHLNLHVSFSQFDHINLRISFIFGGLDERSEQEFKFSFTCLNKSRHEAHFGLTRSESTTIILPSENTKARIKVSGFFLRCGKAVTQTTICGREQIADSLLQNLPITTPPYWGKVL